MNARTVGTEAVGDLYLEWTASRIRGVQNDPESWGDLTAEPRQVDYIETRVANLPAIWAVPHACADDRVLLCLHGGGFVGGSMYTHRKLFAHLAKLAGARALVIEYRLAPEHTHPAPVDDATAALLISPWVDMEQSGDSYRSNWATEAFFYKELVDGLAATFLGSAGDPRD